MTEHLDVVRDGAVMTLAFARTEKKNALTAAMYDGAKRAFERAAVDADIAAVVVTGRGGVFTAGNDVEDFLRGGEEAGEPALRFLRTLARFEKPVVAAVEGAAVGIGTTMLFHCDLVYAASNARFALPFVDIGIVPEAASSLLIPARVGLAKASEWILLGERFDAEEALRTGVVNAVVGNAELQKTAAESARRLAAKPKAALAASRKLLKGDPEEIVRRIDLEGAELRRALGGEEARTAFERFLSKAKH